jgi:uncharacterized protein YegL
MRGEPISTVNDGLTKLAADLQGNPYALETVWLSLITFSTGAQLLLPLTEVFHLRMPALHAKGRSDLGAALRLLDERLNSEVRPSSGEVKGDWRPVIFILSDGSPSDGWITPAKTIRARHDAGRSVVIAFGFGGNVRVANLQRLTPQVMVSQSNEPDSLSRFLQWVSTSVGRSCSIGRGGAESLSNLPPPPSGIYMYRG